MRYATTFSGIGGWELGLNACGWELAWQCEREPFCQTLLAERFGVPICPDIHELPEWLVRQFGSIEAASVDALIGSPPCQPFSVAGQRRGVADERHLYPAFIRAVSVLRPRYVLMENVPGLLSNRRVFGSYIGGLAALGYDLVWHCIPASAVGANHERDRLWIVSHLNPSRLPQRVQTGANGAHAPNITQRHRLAKFPSNSVSGLKWLNQPVVGGGVHGIPNRVDRLKGLGNAVIPQIPFLIGQAINEIEGLI